jgi:hypothetical protein
MPNAPDKTTCTVRLSGIRHLEREVFSFDQML